MNSEVMDKVKDTFNNKTAEEWEEILELRKETMLEKYGVEHSMHVPEIAEKAFLNSHKWKIYTLPSGKEIKVQGYENFALDELLSAYSEDEILHSRSDMPEIFYLDNDRKRRYYPDFYVPSENLVVEVKSDYTLNADFDVFEMKKRATEELGFKFQLLVF
jgi:hypothetical protein